MGSAEKSRFHDNFLQVFDAISEAKPNNDDPADPLCVIQKSNYEKLLVHIEELHIQIEKLELTNKSLLEQQSHIKMEYRKQIAVVHQHNA